MKTTTRKTKVLSIVLALILCLSIGSLSAAVAETQAAGLTVLVSDEYELVEALAPRMSAGVMLMDTLWFPQEGITVDQDMFFSAFPGMEVSLHVQAYGGAINFVGEELTVEFDRVFVVGFDDTYQGDCDTDPVYSYADDLTLVNPDFRYFKTLNLGSFVAYGKVAIVSGSFTNAYYGPIISGEHVVLTGGTVIRNAIDQGVYGNTIEIIDADISRCQTDVEAYGEDSSITINGGTIHSNGEWGNNSGVHREMGSTIIINGGTIRDN